jgi:xanthine dehydrogenase accessory factor
MRDLLVELTQALEQGRELVYCSVVETRGSTPQKAGAAMLVFPDGGQSGTLGGGCVEAEVKQRALRVLNEGGGDPSVLTFCLDDNYGWDDGLICGGRMSILAHPVTPRSQTPVWERAVGSGSDSRPSVFSYYRRFRQLVEGGEGCTEAVVLDEKATGVPAGSRFLLDASGRVLQQLAPRLPELLSRNLVAVQTRPRPYAQKGIAYLPILPRITLLIVGGGHVGQAVARLASEVDFEVWVLDDRERYASVERFPTAQRRMVGDIGAKLKELTQSDITPSVYALIVTRGHAHDEEALYHLAGTPAGYVGMIGSKRKIKLIYEDLLARGVSPEALERVHAPLGFAIGSQTVPEIAISIVAELIACRNLGRTLPEARVRVRT